MIQILTQTAQKTKEIQMQAKTEELIKLDMEIQLNSNNNKPIQSVKIILI